MISGALCGMMAINTTQGESERLILNFTEGAGFIGIAVALMGRSHPVGVLLAALLFGFLYQGDGKHSVWRVAQHGTNTQGHHLLRAFVVITAVGGFFKL